MPESEAPAASEETTGTVTSIATATAPATGAGARLDSTAGVSGYAAAAQVYRESGWRGVLPLKRRTKYPPPQGFTGHDGVDPSYPDVLEWAGLYPDGNVGLRLPDGVIGIDVDAYGGKTGGQTFSEAVRRWGPLPDAPRSSSRPEDPVSGIQFFRVPAGTRLLTTLGFPELGFGGVEIIQRHHRYAVCWPSVHPEGRVYQWYGPDGTVVDPPAVDGLPDLPPEWLAEMLEPEPRDILTKDRADVGACLTEGVPSPRVVGRLRTALDACGGSSRHDETLGNVLTLLRFGRQNEPGVRTAVEALGQQFVAAAVATDRDGGAAEAASEYRRMVYGDRAAALLAYDDTDWTRRIPPEGIGLTNGQATANGQTERVADGGQDDKPPGIDEESFWNSCPELTSCRDYARSVRVGPWAMLGAALTVAAATIPPFVVLPALVGSYASVNIFAALCGSSGSSKSAAIAAAHAWLGDTAVATVKPGSGQGIAKCFAYVKKDPKNPAPVQVGKRWSAVAVVPEVDTLNSASKMTGSNLLSELRQAWSGERVGNDYADDTKTVTLQPHRYRLCMVVGVQPLRAEPLFADADAGTPQRFVWLPTDDPGAPEDPGDRPPALGLPPWSLPQGSGGFFTPPPGQWPDRLHELPDENEFIVLAVPPEAVAEVQAAALDRLLGTPGVDPLGGHRLLCRLKVAAALMRLRQHDGITAEDWQLAGTVMEVSDRTRAQIQEEIAAAAAARNVRAARASGTRKVVEADVVADAEAADVVRVAGLIVAALERARGCTLSGSAVRQALGSERNRALADRALEGLEVDGRVSVEPVEYRGQSGIKVTLTDAQQTS